MIILAFKVRVLPAVENYYYKTNHTFESLFQRAILIINKDKPLAYNINIEDYYMLHI